MRIGFVERLAQQTMATKGMTRNAALTRQALVWGALAAICFAIWAFAPIKEMVLERRGTAVPLDFLLAACGAIFAAMALLFLLSRERQ